MKKTTILASLILSSSLSFAFDLNALTKDVIDTVTKPSTTNEQTTTKEQSSLESSTVSSGLKEALKKGVSYAVSTLGKENGYLSNSNVKIPLPDNLSKVETLIRKAGGNEIADNLINSMNKAATKAAPKTADIFMKSIENMSIEDAKKILAGNNEAATNYFKSNTSDSLRNMIKPIIQETMKDNQVATYYDMANNFYKTNVKSMVDESSVMGLAKNFGVDSYLPGSSDKNLDEYVTDKAIDGLFKMIAQKEADIRTNPVAQTTSILQKVFGN
tara:strand:+ start:954 stop:1769 length:816 start_codon:yes stop_codon:yes gene_type:complete